MIADEFVTVELARSIGPRRGPLYGPGRARVPASFARALGLTPITETSAPTADETAECTPLPDDFPVRDLLIAGGITTIEAVREATDKDLRALKGIGPAAVRDIRAALP